MNTLVPASEPPAEAVALPPLPLEELLRKCHRDELLPLAKALNVNPHGLGLGRLADVISWALRRAGGNEVGNLLLRGGEGPTYPALLSRLTRKLGRQPGPDIEATELILLEVWMSRAWADLDPRQREEVWRRLDLPGSAPADSLRAVQEAREALGSSFGYFVGSLAMGGVARLAGLVLLPIIGPLAPLMTLFWLTQPKEEVVLPAVLEVSRLRQVVHHRVTVGVVGSPSSGKDAAIRAIFGIDSGNIDPVAGSTREVTITRLPGATALFVVNTPGLGDVVESVTEEARQVLDHIDVYVYVLNSQGGVQSRELADWRQCTRTGRPALVVVNKIDTLREEDRERYLADARVKLEAGADCFMAAAFDPLPQLSPERIGVQEVRDWLTDRLIALGKDPGELPWGPPPYSSSSPT